MNKETNDKPHLMRASDGTIKVLQKIVDIGGPEYIFSNDFLVSGENVSLQNGSFLATKQNTLTENSSLKINHLEITSITQKDWRILNSFEGTVSGAKFLARKLLDIQGTVAVTSGSLPYVEIQDELYLLPVTTQRVDSLETNKEKVYDPISQVYKFINEYSAGYFDAYTKEEVMEIAARIFQASGVAFDLLYTYPKNFRTFIVTPENKCQFYLSKIDNNKGNQPETSPSQWTYIPDADVPIDEVIKALEPFITEEISKIAPDLIQTEIDKLPEFDIEPALEAKQNKLTAGTGITIDSNNTISSTASGGPQVFTVDWTSKTTDVEAGTSIIDVIGQDLWNTIKDSTDYYIDMWAIVGYSTITLNSKITLKYEKLGSRDYYWYGSYGSKEVLANLDTLDLNTRVMINHSDGTPRFYYKIGSDVRNNAKITKIYIHKIGGQ